MLEYLNSLASLILMGFSLPVAMIIGNRGLWLERLSIVAVQVGLFLGVVNPWVDWAPAVSWPQAYLTIAASAMLLIWWRRVWTFIRHYLGPQDVAHRRRRTDWPQAAAPAHRDAVMSHWHGRPKT